MTDQNQNSDAQGFIPLDEPDETEAQPETQVINFNVNDQRIAEAKEEFKDVDAHKDMDGAKAAKKILTKMRTTISEAHKVTKAKALAFGKRCDTEKNRLLALIAEVEDPISKQITDIKNAAAIKEENRTGVIMEHIERLNSYALDRHDLTVEQIKERRANLAKEPLTEEIYQELLSEARMAHEEADSKLRIVLQRELNAAEEKAAQAKVAEENARKQKELDERRAKMDAEEGERNRQAVEDAANQRLLDEQAVAEKKAELDRQAAEQAAEQKKIDDENARIAQEQADKEEAEAKAAKDEEERLADLARAPDRDKLLLYADEIDKLVGTAPVMQSQEGANTVLFTHEQLTEVADTVRKCVEEMK